MSTNWLERLQNGTNLLSRTERELVEFVNSHPERAAFLTQRELAEEAGVSKPVLISCYKHLGFENYRSFQESVERFFSTQIDSLRATERVQDRVATVEALIEEAVDVDIRTLERLRSSVAPELLKEIAHHCLTSQTIYIFGEGTGYYPAHYLSQRLRRYGRRTILVGQDPSHRPDTLHPLGPEDALLLFNYADEDRWLWPFFDLARERAAWTLLVSGTIHPDYVARANRFIHVPRGEVQFKNSVAAPMHFANLMLLACEVLYRQETKEQLLGLETTRSAWKGRGE